MRFETLAKSVPVTLAVALSAAMSLVGVLDAGVVPSGAAVAHQLSASVSSISFPDTTLGDFTVSTFDVTNTGSGSATIENIYPAGGDFDDFTTYPDPSCPYTSGSGTNITVDLPSGASCTIDAYFVPGALGARSSTLAVQSTPSSSLTIPVSGTGTIGYYQVSSTGAVAHFGDAAFYGDLSGSALNKPVVGIAQTGDDGGYWLVASDGGIFSYGDAGFYGSAGGIHLNKPIVGMAATPDASGYWLVASDGGIFSYGDAGFFGSTGSIHLNQPIVGMAATPDGEGYWLVASDGGIFAFGDAGFYGSRGGQPLNKPIVGMAATPDGKGYWLVASDGGIFSYGDAGFYGSAGSLRLNQPINAMTAMPDGSGYWFTAADGGLFAYGGAPFLGAANSVGLTNVVAMTTDGAPTLQASNDLPAVRAHAAATGWHAGGAEPHGRLLARPG